MSMLEEYFEEMVSLYLGEAGIHGDDRIRVLRVHRSHLERLARYLQSLPDITEETLEDIDGFQWWN